MHAADMESKGQLRRTSILAPASDLDRLKQIAESEHRTMTQELRRLISERVAEVDAEKAAA